MYSKNASTIRRMGVLQKILSQGKIQQQFSRAFKLDGKITIGDITRDVKIPKNPEYVPQKYSKKFYLIFLYFELLVIC